MDMTRDAAHEVYGVKKVVVPKTELDRLQGATSTTRAFYVSLTISGLTIG